MARKKVSRSLAPLPKKRALDEADHKTERLIEILREVAVKNQREQARAFMPTCLPLASAWQAGRRLQRRPQTSKS
jgi:hypothetical protein